MFNTILSVYIIFLTTAVGLYLNKQNQDSLFNLIRHPKLTIYQRTKINTVLLYCYKNWAIKQAYLFKMKHKYKCKRISTSELTLSSIFGLYKSTLKYNGEGSFTNFAIFYVKSELFKTLTESYSMNTISKYERRKSKNETNRVDISNNDFVFASHEEWKYDSITKYTNENLERVSYFDKMREIWEIIYKYDAFTVRIFSLKYDNEFNTLRTNKVISLLMCCSEEYVRKILSRTKKQILPFISPISSI
jgi:hypothetical protein